MNNKIKIYQTPQLLAEGLAEFFWKLSEKVLNEKEIYSIALSGGSTPKIFFSALASEYRYKINWENVHLFWVDERCVPPTDIESNFGMTKQFLIDKIPIPEKNIHRMKGEMDTEEEAERYSLEITKNLPAKNSLPVFDFIMLGIGEDGHTASIFPNQMNLLQSEKICGTAYHPVSHQKRITLTGKVINNSSEVAFVVTGKNKAVIISDIFTKDKRSESYPASYINPTSGNLYWFLDNESASLLNNKL